MSARGFVIALRIAALVPVLTGLPGCRTSAPGGAIQSSGVVPESRHITSGKVKSYTPGREITIDVSMGRDQSYDLSRSEPGKRVAVSPNLEVGDPVAVVEYDENGIQCVDIVPQADLSEGFVANTRANGRVTAYAPGKRITVRLDSGGTRSFDMRRSDGPHVFVERGIAIGDAVCVVEGERKKQRVVRIVKSPGKAANDGAAASAAKGK